MIFGILALLFLEKSLCDKDALNKADIKWLDKKDIIFYHWQVCHMNKKLLANSYYYHKTRLLNLSSKS
jgi:hypothetical protein